MAGSVIFQITVKECHNEDAQCAFVVDKILEIASDGSAAKCSFGNIAILYRRQVKFILFKSLVYMKLLVGYGLTNYWLILHTTGVWESVPNSLPWQENSI